MKEVTGPNVNSKVAAFMGNRKDSFNYLNTEFPSSGVKALNQIEPPQKSKPANLAKSVVFSKLKKSTTQSKLTTPAAELSPQEVEVL